MTVLEVLQSTTAYFKKHNVESPRLNAEHLVAYVLGRTRIELYLEFERELTEAEIYAVDISEDALELARENAARLGLSDRVRFFRSNLLQDVDGTFDLIVANLPYIATQDRHTLSREVLHDPHVALFGGAYGEEFVRELIAQAPA